MARHDIRGVKLPDGTYVLTAKDIYNINDNNIQISQEVYGSSDFTKKLDKQVKKNATDIADITTRVGDTEGNYTEVVQSVDAVTTRVTNVEGDVSTAQQTADSVTLNFNNMGVGGRNLLKNGNFANSSRQSWDDWGTCGKSFIVENGITYLWIAENTTAQYKGILQLATPLEHGKKYTLSFTAKSKYTTENKMDILIHQSGDGNNIPQISQEFILTTTPKRYILTFDATTILGKNFFRVHVGKSIGEAFSIYITDVMLQVGDKATAFTPKEGEFTSTTHLFDASGYTLKDSNNEALLTPAGVANEQNIGRADNAENGYPMTIPFHIGTEVSQIRQAVLKWDITPFRTYSKGSVSGGGSTSGASSRSSTDATWDSSGVAEGTSSVEAYAGLAHQHTISLWKLAHSHGIAHTHSTPNHAHLPEFGILMTPVTDYTTYVHVDGVHRTTLTTQRGEVDLSSWITTSGWHTIELRTPVLKRIDANLFLKTYIRR